MDWNEIPHDQCHIGDPLGVSKMISDPMLRSAQTVHQSCVKISTISKQAKTSIHLSLVTKEYHRVCLKWFPSLWYVQRKPCTYLVSRLALSPNRMKQVTTWASSPRSTIGCIPKWFLSYVWRKSCTYLALTLTVSPNGLKQDSTLPMSPRRSIRCVQNDFWAYGTFGANHAPILCQD
jgi:hypothetical protein